MRGSQVQPLPQSVDLLALHAQYPQRYPFLLESTCGPSAEAGQHGRYDLLFAFPGAYLSLGADGRLETSGLVAAGSDFLDALDRWFAEQTVAPLNDLPFQGGWFLYLGYELSGQVEPVLKLPMAPLELPAALAVRCPAAVIHDRVRGRSYLVTETGQENFLKRMAEDIDTLSASTPSAPTVKTQLREEPPERFIQAVESVKRYIRAGDVFQVNLSRRWQFTLQDEINPADLYRHLRQVNPAPFSGLMQWLNTAVLCSSPERLVQSRGRDIQTRPIAGTRPRRIGQQDDQQQAQALLKHPKERAEHVMLIDLERNDLGRICKPGSVHVNEFMTVESYAHVHHIVSNVQGTLRNDVGPGSIIRAVFPGGTITGCPKVRCMQIIAEQEGEGRGAYTGSMGYLDRSGALDLNILIRSLVMRGKNGWFRTGSGIVADSNPQRELEETRAKALGLLRLFEVNK